MEAAKDRSLYLLHDETLELSAPGQPRPPNTRAATLRSWRPG
jgi:hypothetical protein